MNEIYEAAKSSKFVFLQMVYIDKGPMKVPVKFGILHYSKPYQRYRQGC
jgi:hypothetical protein